MQSFVEGEIVVLLVFVPLGYSVGLYRWELVCTLDTPTLVLLYVDECHTVQGII